MEETTRLTPRQGDLFAAPSEPAAGTILICDEVETFEPELFGGDLFDTPPPDLSALKK